MKKNPRPMGIDPGLKCTTNVSILYNLGPRKQGGHFLFFNLQIRKNISKYDDNKYAHYQKTLSEYLGEYD